MLSFVQSFFTPKACPIGIDFGTETLRMAQVRRVGPDLRLIAAASMDVPSHVRHDPAGRNQFFVEAVKELFSAGRFVGRQAVLALPAHAMHIQHLRLAKMDEEARRKAIPWEVRGKLPIDPSHAILRHHVAGEIYQDQEPRDEVVLMAASKELVNQTLSAAARARLDIVGMDVEPKALLDCFSHVYRRKADAELTNCFVDIGADATRAVVTRGPHILFARVISVGGDHFNRAAAEALGVPLEDARMLRLREAATVEPTKEPAAPQPVAPPMEEPTAEQPSPDHSFALLGVCGPKSPEVERRAPGPSDPQLAVTPIKPAELSDAGRVDAAIREPIARLVQELDLCRRYYEATFPSKPIDRLVFVGGEAHQRRVCQRVAMELGLAAQIGDPMVRMARYCDLQADAGAGLDPSRPQPSWAVAMGLTMGAAVAAAAAGIKS